MFSFRYRNNKALCLSDNCFINNKNAKYTNGSTKNPPWSIVHIEPKFPLP